MPIDRLIRAGAKAKQMYDEKPARAPAPRPAPAPKAPPPRPTNQSRANVAADALGVPGRDVVRGAMARRKKMLDDL